MCIHAYEPVLESMGILCAPAHLWRSLFMYAYVCVVVSEGMALSMH